MAIANQAEANGVLCFVFHFGPLGRKTSHSMDSFFLQEMSQGIQWALAFIRAGGFLRQQTGTHGEVGLMHSVHRTACSTAL